MLHTLLYFDLTSLLLLWILSEQLNMLSDVFYYWTCVRVPAAPFSLTQDALAFFSTIHLRSSEISFYPKRLSEKGFNGRCSSCLLTGLSQLSLKPATKPCILWPQRVRGWCIWCYLSVEVIQAQQGGCSPAATLGVSPQGPSVPNINRLKTEQRNFPLRGSPSYSQG